MLFAIIFFDIVGRSFGILSLVFVSFELFDSVLIFLPGTIITVPSPFEVGIGWLGFFLRLFFFSLGLFLMSVFMSLLPEVV